MTHLPYRMWFLIFALWAALSPAHGLAEIQPEPGYPESGQPGILVLGDSLSASYGFAQTAGWVNLLQLRLSEQGYPYQVINSSISGETTSGGLTRLAGALQAHHPAIVIIELGANDGLRGLPLAKFRQNLALLIEQSQASGAQVLLMGMRLPPNYGPAYTQRFHQTYIELGKQYSIPVLPFFLDGVAGNRELVQDDGLHPRSVAQPLLLENVWVKLEPLLTKPDAS